jgi:threonine dehydratase
MNPDQVEAASQRTEGYLRVTPVMDLAAGEVTGMPVNVKLELLQHTGSFKPRGMFSKLTSEAIGDRQVMVASGGNAGLAVAHAARQLGHRARVYVPDSSPEAKVQRLRAIGADVRQGGRIYDEARAALEADAAGTDAFVVHAYDQPEVVAGQGMIFREWERQNPGLDTVLVSVGGGGLVAGALAWWQGRVKVVAVEPETSQCLHSAVAAGEIVEVAVEGRAVDSLGARRVGTLCWSLCGDLGGSVVVSDSAIAESQHALWNALRLVVEPGGAAAMAALRSGAYRPEPGERVGVLVCGANCDPASVMTAPEVTS